MAKKKKGARFGKLLFFIPIILILVLIGYAIIQTQNVSGTLVVKAQSSDRYYKAVGLNVTASVGTQSGVQSGVTPFSLTLGRGTYTVSFPNLQWYLTPPARVVTVDSGRTSYAIGLYEPVVDQVIILQNHFNSTQVTALQGVTPVVWVNKMGSVASLQSDLLGNIPIPSSGNFTYVFTQTGTFVFNVGSTQPNQMTVVVI